MSTTTASDIKRRVIELLPLVDDAREDPTYFTQLMDFQEATLEMLITHVNLDLVRNNNAVEKVAQSVRRQYVKMYLCLHEPWC